MKKVKYNHVGTKELSENANQIKDEREADINSAIEHYGLDKKLFYTIEDKRKTAEFTLENEVTTKASRVIEMLAGKRMSDKQMRELLESKKRIAKVNLENAKKPRKEKPTKAELDDYKDKYLDDNIKNFGKSTFQGWIKSAAREFNLDRTTISKIYHQKEK